MGAAAVGVLTGATTSFAEPLCAFRTEAGAIVYSNTPSNDGVCASEANALPAPAPSLSTIARYDGVVSRYAARYGVPTRLVHAVIATESAYNPGALSSRGACGLMQLMPETAKRYGVTELFDPDANIRAGVAHLRDLLDMFRGDTRLAVAAYNAGAEAVRRYPGVPPFAETRQYVARVLSRLNPRALAGLTRNPPPGKAVRPAIEVRVTSSGTVSWAN